MNKNHKISVLLDGKEFHRFEAYCAEVGFKKSTLIARLIREHVDKSGYIPCEITPNSDVSKREE